MTSRERLHNCLNRKNVDKLPVVEWAPYWDLTYNRWIQEGLSGTFGIPEMTRHLGLEYYKQYWLIHRTDDCPTATHHGAPLIETPEEYLSFKQYLFPKNAIEKIKDDIYLNIKKSHDTGDTPVFITFEGFFWFPRTLFGIENHLLSFYDYPELYHTICKDLLEFHLKCLDELCDILTPDFATIAEDMSYNSGPFISKEIFDEFLLPYYKVLLAALKKRNIKAFIDTDGNINKMLPWLTNAGFDGVLPLERQSGIDLNEIRVQYPELLMIGGFDKMCLKNGTAAITRELQRLYPAMVSGGYIPSMDHQTPPDCSLENYLFYTKSLSEFCAKAALERINKKGSDICT